MQEATPTTIVRLLGAPEILRDGRVQAFDTRKAVAIIAFLALTGRRSTRDRLCVLLWPESPQSKARSALRRTLSTVRALLGTAAVAADRESVQLLTDGIEVDVLALLAKSESDVREDLEWAAELFRGDLLEGFSVRGSPEFEDWHRAESEALRRRMDDVLARLSTQASASGDHREAIGYAERRVNLDRLNEPAHRALMLAEARSGRRAQAVERYRDVVRTLGDELGVAPLPETTELYESIRRGDVLAYADQEARTKQSSVPSRLPPRPRLIGRDEEVRLVTERFMQAAYSGRVLGVVGESGMGKSHLATELAARYAADGARVSIAHCHLGESDLPYAAIAQTLAELVDAGDPTSMSPSSATAVAALLPSGVGSPVGREPQIGEADGRIRFFESLRLAFDELVRAERPAFIVLDDFHHVDRASAEFVGYLQRRISSMRLLLLLTWSPHDLAPEAPARSVVDAVPPADVVALGKLAESDIAAIVAESSRMELDSEVTTRIVQRSGGVPLFAAELARAAGSSEERLPGQVRTVLRQKLDRAGQVAAQVLATASVLGRAFAPELIRDISGRTELEVAEALDELEDLGIIGRESADPSSHYEFTHAGLRELAYERVTAGRRRLLHGRVADALTSAARPGASQLGEAARHAESAGDRRRAATLFAQAGEAARSMYANAEAAEWFTAALTLGHSDPGALHEDLGDLATLAGEYRRATEQYEAAAAVVDRSDRARIEHKLGGVYSRRGDWATADTFLRVAADLAGDGTTGDLLCDLAINAHRLGREAEARAFAERARTLGKRQDDPAAMARAANTAGLLERSAGSSRAALAHLEDARRAAMVAGDEEMLVAVLNNLALTVGAGGDHERAVTLFDEALVRCRRLGDRHREAAVLSNRGDALHAMGQSERAARSVKQSARILAEIGFEAEQFIPEVWSLREW